MVFTKRLRERIVQGEITCSVRIWVRPHVREGQRYRMGDGEIHIDSITPIGFPDITPQLAQASGFLGVLDLLKTAQHGAGNSIYLVRFHYLPAKKPRQPVRKTPTSGPRALPDAVKPPGRAVPSQPKQKKSHTGPKKMAV